MQDTNYGEDWFIAEVHNSAKEWITYTEYTISESNAGGEILHLRYKSDGLWIKHLLDITTFSVFQKY